MKKLFLILLLFSIISCVINIGDVNQRHGELKKSCKSLLKKPKTQVYSEMLRMDMGAPESVIVTSDSTETVYFYKRYVTKNKNRYYDEIIFDFKNDVLKKFKVNLVR